MHFSKLHLKQYLYNIMQLKINIKHSTPLSFGYSTSSKNDDDVVNHMKKINLNYKPMQNVCQ